MIIKFAIALVGGLLVPVVLLIVHKIITNRLSLLRAKKLTRGMPMYEEYNLLGNHTLTLSFGENCRKYQRAHELNGPYLVGLFGDKLCVSTTDLDLIKQIVIDEANLERMQLHLPIGEVEQSILLVPPSDWRRHRRVFAPALKGNKFKSPNVINEIDESIGKLINYIERQLGDSNEINLEADDIIHKYSLNLVMSSFYKQDNLVNFDDPNDRWTAMVGSMSAECSRSWPLKLSLLFPWFRRPLDWFVWNFHELGVARRQIINFVRRQTKLGLEARKQANELASKGELRDKNNFVLKDGTSFKRNIVDNLIDGFLEGKLNQTEFFNSSSFLLQAADKTAADCIVFTLYLLSIYPSEQEYLRKSVQVEGAESEYLAWVLNESLRLMPPVPAGCSRQVNRNIELKQNGWLIPADTMLVTNAYVIHRLKQYWGDDADEFKPERWADTSRHHPMQYMPFGAGARGCLGRDFALFSLKAVFVALITRYKFEGKPRADALKFSSPSLIFVVPNSSTYVTIKRIVQS